MSSQAILRFLSLEYMAEVGVYFIYRVTPGPFRLQGISQYLGESRSPDLSTFGPSSALEDCKEQVLFPA